MRLQFYVQTKEISKNNQLYGVLDLDSTSFGRFSKEDQIIFEEIAEILVQHL